MKVPGPDHPITTEAFPGRVRVRFGDRLVAESDNALMLQEGHLPPVCCLPRGDTEVSFLARSSTVIHCPYKGDANYHSMRSHARVVEDAVWTYEQPSPHVASIKDRLAFYPGKVTIELA